MKQSQVTTILLISLALFSSLYVSTSPFTKAASTFGLDPNENSHAIQRIASGTSITLTISTTNPGDLIYACAYTINYNPIVTLGGTSSLSWTSRGTDTYTSSSNYGKMECWYAISTGTLSSKTVTFTADRASGGMMVMVFAISGANTISPFDPSFNSAVHKHDYNNGAIMTPTVSISTTHADDMIIGFIGKMDNSISNQGSGYTRIDHIEGGSNPGTSSADEYQIVAGTKSNFAVSFSESSSRWIVMADAIKPAITATTTTDTALSYSTIALGGSITDTATVTSSTCLYKDVIFVSAGTPSGTIANPSPSYPTGLQVNDLILLQVTIRDVTTFPIVQADQGFTALYNGDLSGSVSVRGRQWIYYKFTDGSEDSSLTVTIEGSSCKMARMYAFRNVELTNFIDGTDVTRGTDYVITQPSVTTNNVNRFVVALVSVNDNNAVGGFTGTSGGIWTEQVSEFTYDGGTSIEGDDGSIQLQTAQMTATTISGGSYNMGNSDPWAVRAFALKPIATLLTGSVDFQALAPSGSWTTYDTQNLISNSATSETYTPNIAGLWYFRAIYTGDINYFSSQSADNANQLTVTVTQATSAITELKVNPNPVDTNHPITTTVSGYLKSGTTPISGQVILSYDVGNGLIQFATPATDANGLFSSTDLPVNSLPIGPCFIKAEFLTTTNYLGCTSTVDETDYKLTVVPEYILGGLAALGACFVGFALFKKRSSLPQLRLK